METFDSDDDDIDSGGDLDQINSFDDPGRDDSAYFGRKRPATLRKAPQAPKRFKSSYILFFMAKQQEIKNEIGPGAGVGEVSKKSSEMWKKLTDEERLEWEEKANKDKERYNEERRAYTGPWQVPWKRAKKDPSAPKRPMSAFLYFSQDKRKVIKAANPDMANTEISRVLGEMWKNCTPEERQIHIDREADERKQYKIDIAAWRKDDAVRKEKARVEQMEKAKLAKTMNIMNNPFRPPAQSMMMQQGIHPAYYHPAPPQVSTPPHMASYPHQRPGFFPEQQYVDPSAYYPPPYGYHPYNPHPAPYGHYAYPQFDYPNYPTMGPPHPHAVAPPPMMGSDPYLDPDSARSGFPSEKMNRDTQMSRYPSNQAPSMQPYMGDRSYQGYDYGMERR